MSSRKHDDKDKSHKKKSSKDHGGYEYSHKDDSFRVDKHKKYDHLERPGETDNTIYDHQSLEDQGEYLGRRRTGIGQDVEDVRYTYDRPTGGHDPNVAYYGGRPLGDSRRERSNDPYGQPPQEEHEGYYEAERIAAFNRRQAEREAHPSRFNTPERDIAPEPRGREGYSTRDRLSDHSPLSTTPSDERRRIHHKAKKRDNHDRKRAKEEERRREKSRERRDRNREHRSGHRS